ncbi:hypothetical protein RS9916_38347 [Synechococcus sp. RS9916]|nr:hypothetical protein RS9916_38347 [Synechococcus sp. RS9916]
MARAISTQIDRFTLVINGSKQVLFGRSRAPQSKEQIKGKILRHRADAGEQGNNSPEINHWR